MNFRDEADFWAGFFLGTMLGGGIVGILWGLEKLLW